MPCDFSQRTKCRLRTEQQYVYEAGNDRRYRKRQIDQCGQEGFALEFEFGDRPRCDDAEDNVERYRRWLQPAVSDEWPPEHQVLQNAANSLGWAPCEKLQQKPTRAAATGNSARKASAMADQNEACRAPLSVVAGAEPVAVGSVIGAGSSAIAVPPAAPCLNEIDDEKHEKGDQTA